MSWIHWVLVIAVGAILFGGRGKLSGLMGEAGKGIRAFKSELKTGKDVAAAADPIPAQRDDLQG